VTTANVLYMLLILGLVWGGFAFCLFVMMRQREADEGSE